MKQSKEDLIARLDEIMKDESYECNTKYPALSQDLEDSGYTFDAGLVTSINTDECRHAEIYRAIRNHIIEQI
jgi:rubrerythrin